MDQIKKSIESISREDNADILIKGKALPIGTIKKRPNGNFIKTASGWKYHSKHDKNQKAQASEKKSERPQRHQFNSQQEYEKKLLSHTGPGGGNQDKGKSPDGISESMLKKVNLADNHLEGKVFNIGKGARLRVDSVKGDIAKITKIDKFNNTSTHEVSVKDNSGEGGLFSYKEIKK